MKWNKKALEWLHLIVTSIWAALALMIFLQVVALIWAWWNNHELTITWPFVLLQIGVLVLFGYISRKISRKKWSVAGQKEPPPSSGRSESTIGRLPLHFRVPFFVLSVLLVYVLVDQLAIFEKSKQEGSGDFWRWFSMFAAILILFSFFFSKGGNKKHGTNDDQG